jgi:hypothetical protein
MLSGSYCTSSDSSAGLIGWSARLKILILSEVLVSCIRKDRCCALEVLHITRHICFFSICRRTDKCFLQYRSEGIATILVVTLFELGCSSQSIKYQAFLKQKNVFL